ncbi:glutamate carboxypeptidase [Salipiger thiooxidans]|uniref:Glutamate carboxypeptidase n=1 Tax=Salipiger thiooxidans TaxID=282683 RepID=A0A1G7F692_9RHOB|nr:M20/M25/M40 family metallo-hydrolase [Salipiger thiooxidans]SDE71409.1 glutamate carboxypeptidase [Salipiger thiooxidans]
MTDFASLPFDADEMLAGLARWVACESPTHDAAAVNRMMDLAAFDLARLGAEVQRVPGQMGLSDSLIATLPHPRPELPGILVLGHMDTVHPVGTLEVLPVRREGDICYGPGINDMKGGNYLALEAIGQLQRAGIETPLPVTVMFTGDEEIGSPSSARLIEDVARRHACVLVPEPARADGSVVHGRHAILRFALQASGRPSHAGNIPEKGASAIALMARKLLEIEALSCDAFTCSVGIIRGGQWSNCVPSACEAEMILQLKDPAAREDALARLQALTVPEGDVTFAITPGVARPAWQPGSGCKALLDRAEGLARDLGFHLPSIVSGGGSDGNFTGALGVPTLDGLGVRGQMHHTLQEHIWVDSLAERGRLFAGLLATIDGPPA